MVKAIQSMVQIAITAAVALLPACAGGGVDHGGEDNIAVDIKMTVKAEHGEQDQDHVSAMKAIQDFMIISYPSGWVVGMDWCDDGTKVDVLDVPDFDLVYTRGGQPVPMTDSDFPSLIAHDASNAVVMAGGVQYEVPTDHLLVNLSEFLPNAAIDPVYSYSAPSDCAGQAIPGLTGCRVDGYVSEDYDAYLDRMAVPVPCAYGTYMKLVRAEMELNAQGYRLMIWDCYRPYRGSVFISDRFVEAYEDNPLIRESIGQWSLDWYAANGPSGHNFGTDVDLGLTDMDYNVIEMPSHFDAFDEMAHLVDAPMSSSSITEERYTEAVKANPACLALHRAFKNAGFSELASEWWHFGDDETEAAVKAVVGAGGLDFVAQP